MTRFLLALVILVSGPAFAKDDGGFGSERFTARAPAALTDDKSVQDNFAVIDQNAADIEPAAGDTPDKNIPAVQESSHKTDPYIIKKDLEVR
jgi:hypothetical protein